MQSLWFEEWKAVETPIMLRMHESILLWKEVPEVGLECVS